MKLIDLDAFREEYDLLEHCEDCGRRNKKACDYPSYSARDFCGWLDDVPTVDAAPVVHGEWIGEDGEHVPLRDGIPAYSCSCSICGDYLVGSDEYEPSGYYCPNCGAKMDLKEEPNGTDNP